MSFWAAWPPKSFFNKEWALLIFSKKPTKPILVYFFTAAMAAKYLWGCFFSA
jgi:hypothetical protein